MKIDDNGIVRDMTPEEEAAYRAEIASLEGAAEDATSSVTADAATPSPQGEGCEEVSE